MPAAMKVLAAMKAPRGLGPLAKLVRDLKDGLTVMRKVNREDNSLIAQAMCERFVCVKELVDILYKKEAPHHCRLAPLAHSAQGAEQGPPKVPPRV